MGKISIIILRFFEGENNEKFLIIALTAMMLLVFTGCDKPKE